MNLNKINSLLKIYNLKLKCEKFNTILESGFYSSVCIKVYTADNLSLFSIDYKSENLLGLLSVLLGFKPAYYGLSIKNINKINLLKFGVKFQQFKVNDLGYYPQILYNNKISIKSSEFETIFNNIRENHDKIGKLLGYPEFAIDYFVNNSEDFENRVVYIGHGFSFSLHNNDYEKCEEYMEKYKLPNIFYKLPYQIYFNGR